MVMKADLDIQDLLVNKVHPDHLAQLVFPDHLEKKEEMPKNLLADQDLKVPVVLPVQLAPLVLQVLMLQQVNLDPLVHKEVQVLPVHKVTKDQKVKLDQMVDQAVMPITVLAQPVTLMPVVEVMVATTEAHTNVSKQKLVVQIYDCTKFFSCT